jgi:transposase
MERRRTYTKEYKESALELYHSSGKSAKEVADELGIPRENICRWLQESGKAELGNIRVFPGLGNPGDEEAAQLKKEAADLRETNEILKKAMAYFVVKNPR